MLIKCSTQRRDGISRDVFLECPPAGRGRSAREPRVPTRHGPPATTRHGRAEISQSAHAISDANGGGEILALHPQWKCMQFAHRGVLLERPVG